MAQKILSPIPKNIIVGDKHKITGVSHNVILGSSDDELETTVEDVVMIGHNAKANIKNLLR